MIDMDDRSKQEWAILRKGKIMAKNLDIQDGGSEILGKWNFQKSDSGLSNHGGVKPFNHIKGGTDGDPKTYGAHCKRRWILQEVFKGVGMEITKKMEAQNPHK